MTNTLPSVVDDLSPSNTHEADKLLEAIKPYTDADLQLGGSVAKKTHGGDDYDVDIFIKYPMSRRGDTISDDLKSTLESADLDVERVQASRDYFIYHGDHDYELVPVLNIDDPSQAETVIDVSPLHVDYFNDHADHETRLGVRLLKQFMKAHHVYGAESHINGFSGHVVDLLVLAYGSFHDVLQATTEWKPKTIIDVEEHHDTPMLTLNESKTHGPLIVVDPIQPQRNAAAAVNKESYDAFKDAGRAFLNDPGRDAFQVPTLRERVEDARENDDDHTTIQVSVSFDDDRHDVTGSRLQKIKEHLERRLDDANFHVKTGFIHHDDTSAVIITATTTPTTEDNVIQGPPVDQEHHVERFKDAHDTVEEHMGRVIAHEPNPYDTVKAAVKDLVQDDYITSRSQATRVRQHTNPSN